MKYILFNYYGNLSFVGFFSSLFFILSKQIFYNKFRLSLRIFVKFDISVYDNDKYDNRLYGYDGDEFFAGGNQVFENIVYDFLNESYFNILKLNILELFVDMFNVLVDIVVERFKTIL